MPTLATFDHPLRANRNFLRRHMAIRRANPKGSSPQMRGGTPAELGANLADSRRRPREARANSPGLCRYPEVSVISENCGAGTITGGPDGGDGEGRQDRPAGRGRHRAVTRELASPEGVLRACDLEGWLRGGPHEARGRLAKRVGRLTGSAKDQVKAPEGARGRL